MSDSKTPMRIVTMRELIRSVPEHWRASYERTEYWLSDRWGESKQETYKRLLKLNLETCTPADVTAVIGNSSWTYLRCDECGASVDQVLMFGTAGYETSTHSLCAKCVHAAFALWETRS